MSLDTFSFFQTFCPNSKMRQDRPRLNFFDLLSFEYTYFKENRKIDVPKSSVCKKRSTEIQIVVN